MFNKLKENIKVRLKDWLDINKYRSDALYDYDTLFTLHNQNKKQIDGILKSAELDRNTFTSSIKRIETDVNHTEQSIKVLHNTIENVVHIGTDVRMNHSNREHSWAVVCIEGKINIVKFVDLDRQNAREVLDFLKHFEGGRHCIDTPHVEMLRDGFFKF